MNHSEGDFNIEQYIAYIMRNMFIFYFIFYKYEYIKFSNVINDKNEIY